MDPFTIMALVGAGANFYNNQQNKMNSRPANALGNVPMINLAQYQPYLQKTMEAGYNPNSQLYENASQVANAKLNDNLASRGIANSSAGTQAVQGLNTQMANSYIDNQMRRQQDALAAVGGFQNNTTGTNMNLGVAQNGQGWDYYNADMQQNQNNVGAFSGLMGGLSGAFGAQQQQNNYDKLLAAAKTGYGNYGGYQPQQPTNYGSTYNPGGGTGYLGVNTQF